MLRIFWAKQAKHQHATASTAQDAFNKVRAEGLRDAYREARTSTLADSPRIAADIAAAKERMPKQMLAEDDQARGSAGCLFTSCGILVLHGSETLPALCCFVRRHMQKGTLCRYATTP